MENKTVISIETVIGYIEDHLSGKLDLETVATAVNYSKYHLHRIFTKTVGMTMHDYVQRRQLTEAAKLLVFSDKPIIEIAFICGYESQQSFTTAFTAMYKTSPAQYRDKQAFYPLLLRFTLHDKMQSAALTKNDIRLAVMEDIPSWMELLRLVVDGYPVLDETDYLHKLKIFIRNRQALVLKDGEVSSCDIACTDNLEKFNADYLRYTTEVCNTCIDHDLSDEYMVIGTSAIVNVELDGAVGMNSGIFNNPFMIWGRYRMDGEKALLSISFQFHHTQMDGAHAGKFLKNLQEEIERLPYLLS